MERLLKPLSNKYSQVINRLSTLIVNNSNNGSFSHQRIEQIGDLKSRIASTTKCYSHANAFNIQHITFLINIYCG